MPAVELLLIDIPTNTRIVPGQNFQSHGPMMRPSNHAGFTLLPLLPLEPPPPTPPRAIPNGTFYGLTPPVSTNPPEYQSVPEVRKNQAPQYQEIPYATSNGHTSPAEEAQPTSLSTSQQSDTEADQALYGMPSSNSTVPLTESSASPPVPAERRPRKKANPLYDSFGEVVTTSSSSSTRKPAPSKDTCHTIPFRCIKHPITQFTIFFFVVLNLVALLLLFTGTLEQAIPGSTGKLVQPVSMVTGLPDNANLVDIIKDQRYTIEGLLNRVSQLEILLMTNSSENATTTARVAQNTHQIEQLTNQVTALARNTSNQIQTLQDHVSTNEFLSNSNIQKTSELEDEISVLTAQGQTRGQDIMSIKSKNTNQDNEISLLQSRIDTVKQEVDLDLANYNDSIYIDLADISKMQGPPGVNGTRGQDGSSLSGCEYKYYSDSSSFSRDITVGTTHSPREGYVFTGVTCATYGGTIANLMQSPEGSGSLRCQCEGQTAAYSSVSRFCNIHYWQCPLEA